jgi:flagellar basal-body rod protein FlgC
MEDAKRMDILAGLRVSYSGLQAQRARMNVLASNLANANATRTPEGGPYKRQDVIFAASPQATSFADLLDTHLQNGVREVRVLSVVRDPSAIRLEYDPKHPDANAQGFVSYPDINLLQEMVDLVSASRLYEANVTAINTAKDMALRALQIGRI